MQGIIHRHKEVWKDRNFLYSIIGAIIFLLISLTANYFAGTYANSRAGNPVGDIILDNIPTFNVDIIFIEGAGMLTLFITILLLHEPKRIPFALKSIALFVCIRSIFITLTHLGPYPYQDSIRANDLFAMISFGGDLFFSGHTGLPFLMALIFWKNSYLRGIFILISLVFGATVLLGHLHYSIDVFAAYFITYSIFHTAQTFFKKDHELFLSASIRP